MPYHLPRSLIHLVVPFSLSCCTKMMPDREVSEDQANALYASYCASCHGESGGGDGIASVAMTPKPRNFTDANWQNGATTERIAAVIEKGGAGAGLSGFMPKWGGLLKQGEIAGLAHRVKRFAVQGSPTPGTDTRVAAKHGGPEIYEQYCSGCHGGAGEGNGAQGQGLSPKPQNFTDRVWQGTTTDDTIVRVIHYGGAVAGKSMCMPPWGATFDDDMKGLVATIRSFAK